MPMRLSSLVTALGSGAALLLVVATGACDGATGSGAVGSPPVRAELQLDPPLEVAATPVLRRLTATQYRHTLRQWFGDALVLPATLEPDARSDGLYAVGAAVNVLSTLGVERYFAAAASVAEQLVTRVELRDQLLVCDPEAPGCLAEVIDTWATRLWRRPITEAEQARLLAVGDEAMEVMSSFDEGARYAMMAILNSPHFIYVHAPGEGSARPYTSWEMATRLSLFLWNAGPDQGLLDAAADDRLTDDEALRGVVQEMLLDVRARQGFRAFADDWLEMDGLETLSKDPDAFIFFSADLGMQAREETLTLLEHLAFDADEDFRHMMTTTTTFVDMRLAALYGVPAGGHEGFAQITLPADGPRAGLLGHASLLALHGSPNRSSPTLRGLFIRERLLCQPMPSPPANVDTTVPEGSEDAPTMRERLEVHLEAPACAGCHALTDRIGLGLERFDGLGGFRLTENGAPIDPSGLLDGLSFDDARGLGEALAGHADFVPCIVDTLWAYANGRVRDGDELDQAEALVARFEASGHRMLALLEDIAMSARFRRVGAQEEGP